MGMFCDYFFFNFCIPFGKNKTFPVTLGLYVGVQFLDLAILYWISHLVWSLRKRVLNIVNNISNLAGPIFMCEDILTCMSKLHHLSKNGNFNFIFD